MMRTEAIIDCKIEKGVPVPTTPMARFKHGSVSRRYRFDEMDIGDSFFAEVAAGEPLNAVRDSLRVTLSRRKRAGRRGHFIVRNWIARGGRRWVPRLAARMSSASIIGSFMVVCGERPVACFSTRREALDHARLMRAAIPETEVFVAEVLEMLAAYGNGEWRELSREDVLAGAAA